MSDYWGARVYWPPTFYSSAGPYGPSRYHWPPPNEIEFTSPDDQSAATISQIRGQIMAQHPEDISALADQWQNAYNLLDEVHRQLFSQGMALDQQHWQSPEARDAFLKSGPGAALAYLDEWKQAASNNVSILRALVGVVTKSRADMDDLWDRYNRAVEAARDVTFGENLGAWVTGFVVTWDQAKDADATDDLRAAQEQYNEEARQLAYRVAGEYFDTISTSESGYGPPFRPMDAVLNAPGVDRPSMPAPGGLPGAPALGLPPAPVLPAPPGAVGPPGFAGVPAPPATPTTPVVPTASPVPAPPVAPAAPGGPAVDGTGAPAAPIGAPVAAVPPSAIGGGLNPAAARFAAPGAAGLPAQPGGLPQSGGVPPGVPPTGLRSGVLGRPGPPSRPRPTEPPPALRSPLAPPPPGRDPAAPPSGREDGQGHGPTPDDRAFSTPPGAAAPPVLKSARTTDPPRRTSAPAGPRTAQDAPSQPPPPGAAPPVLGAPSRPAPAAPTGRRTGRDRDATGRSGPVGAGDDWLGLGEVRAGAGTGVVNAPTPASGGAGRPPDALRRGRPERADVVPAELSTRKAVPPTTVPDGEVEQPVVTDETAFTVDTPGGGLVAKNRDDPGYRPEPPPALKSR